MEEQEPTKRYIACFICKLEFIINTVTAAKILYVILCLYTFPVWELAYLNKKSAFQSAAHP